MRTSIAALLPYATAALAVVAAPPAAADVRDSRALDEKSWDLGATVSSLGMGLELRRTFGSRLAVRAVLSTYTVKLNDAIDGIEYQGDLDMRSGGLMLDWHPTGDSVRVTAGLLINGTGLKLDAQPSAVTFEIDGQDYSTTEIGTAKGHADFNTIAPYLGIGFRHTFGDDARLGVSVDAGVLFQGEPKFNLSVRCGPAIPLRRCMQLQSDVEDERQNFEEDAKDLAYYPVLSLGITYRIGGS